MINMKTPKIRRRSKERRQDNDNYVDYGYNDKDNNDKR